MLKAVALLSLSACLTACDGYPTEDAPDLNPFALTNAQRISILNDLTGELESSPEFFLGSGCLLEVKTDTGWFSSKRHAHDLSQTSFELRRTAEPDAPYAVAFNATGNAGFTVVLTGRKLLDLQRAMQLLTLIKRDCGVQRSG